MTDENVNPLGADPGSATSLSLLDRVRARDSSAWERLVLLYTPLVQIWCRRAGLQDADAADIGQEVFKAIAGSIGNFEHGPHQGGFRAWLRAVTRNEIRDQWRRQHGHTAAGGSDAYEQLLQTPVNEASDDTDCEESQILYRRALELIVKDFEERTWKAFWLVVIENRAPGDVATDLAMSANAVYLAKARVLARLREEFVGLIEEG
jgi:RNA polymerase sigma-70 factor (ECF subfamily)